MSVVARVKEQLIPIPGVFREKKKESERERDTDIAIHIGNTRRKYTDTSRSRDHLVRVTSEHLRTHAGIFITGISRRLIIVIENSDVHTHSAALSHSDSPAGVAVPFYLEGLSFREGSFPRSRRTRLHRRGGWSPAVDFSSLFPAIFPV